MAEQKRPAKFAGDNLVWAGGLVRKGDPLPDTIPEHLLAQWQDRGVLTDSPPPAPEPPPAEETEPEKHDAKHGGHEHGKRGR